MSFCSWLARFLWPPRSGRPVQPSSACPDFLGDLEEDVYRDDDMNYWAEYAARQPTTRHYLNRCLNR